VYSRNEDDAQTAANDEPTGFGVSGKLWNGVLVMYDRARGSLWTQIDGRAIEGERQGEMLNHVPSSFTTWGAWVAEHPETLVLNKPEDVWGFEHSRYDAYLADPDRVWMPELAEGLGGVRPKTVVFGLRVDGAQTAVTEELLLSDGVVNGLVGNTPVAWIRHSQTGGVLGVERRRLGRVLILAPGDEDGLLLDTLTYEVLRADQLTTLRVDRAFWYAWKRSHEHTLLLRR
jgi:hypothetical protein